MKRFHGESFVNRSQKCDSSDNCVGTGMWSLETVLKIRSFVAESRKQKFY